MSRVSPFKGLRYDLAVVGGGQAVTSRPYDVISEAEQQRYLDASPYNVVRLESNDKGIDDERRLAQHQRSGQALADWRSRGILSQDPEPRYYPYEMRFDLEGAPRRIRGVICVVDIEDWGGSILPHEHVMSRQVQDRLSLIRATMANVSPVYSVFAGPCEPLNELLDGLAEPELTVTDEEGVSHHLWSAQDDRLTGWFADRSLMIADGHHRYTVALAYREEMRAIHGPGPWDQIMMFLVDAVTEDPPVLPIHRILKREIRLDTSAVPDLAGALTGSCDAPPVIGVVRADGTYGVAPVDGDPPAVSALHAGPLRGMEGGRDLTFTADAREAEAAVRGGDSPMAILLPTTSAERIQEIVARGDRMPQKSTFFWPKPRTGMVFRPMDRPDLLP